MDAGADHNRSLLNKRTVSWALYDVANSSYILMIPAVSYAIYFRKVVLADHAAADAIWAGLVSLSLALAGISAPYIGAIADVAGWRHRFFVGATIVCCLATAALMSVSAGQLYWGGFAFVVAHVSYTWAIFLYDSYLRDIVAPTRAAALSGFGWGLGYVGGLVCFALSYPLLRDGIAPENLSRFRWVFGITAAFYFLVAIPAFINLAPVGTSAKPPRDTGVMLAAYRDLWRTVREWRKHRELFKFLIAFYLLSDAIVTVIFFTAVYLENNFGLSVTQILVLTLVVQAIGVPSTMIFGRLGDRWSEKTTILLTVGIWLAVILLMMLGRGAYVPWVMAGSMGLVIGSTQSLCRSLYARMVPADKANEMWGFNAFAGKVSAVLGPLAFGVLSSATGSQRLGLASLLVFFVAGGTLLWTVRVVARGNGGASA